MKKLLAAAVMALCSHTALAQMEGMEGVFHTGPETEKAAEAMMQEVMSSVMAAAVANSGKEIDEKQVARDMFKEMAKHSAPMKAAMQKDCEAQADAKACECFYKQVDLKDMFSQMETAVINASSEEEVEKQLNPYLQDMQAKRAQCKLD